MVISVSVSTPWDQANPRTCMPSFIHFMTTLDWEISVFLLNNQTSKCQRISLAFLTRYARVMPSTYHEVIRLCFHDKKLSFMTSQVCVCAFNRTKITKGWQNKSHTCGLPPGHASGTSAMFLKKTPMRLPPQSVTWVVSTGLLYTSLEPWQRI